MFSCVEKMCNVDTINLMSAAVINGLFIKMDNLINERSIKNMGTFYTGLLLAMTGLF